MIGAWFFVPRGPITQGNYDKLCEGMSEAEVHAILGKPTESCEADPHGIGIDLLQLWRNGADAIVVGFDNGALFIKDIHLATVWETLTWYAKKGADKVGVKWD